MGGSPMNLASSFNNKDQTQLVEIKLNTAVLCTDEVLLRSQDEVSVSEEISFQEIATDVGEQKNENEILLAETPEDIFPI